MNGYFQLDLRPEGTFLRIYAATDGGDPVNINELAEYLQKKGIGYELTDLNRKVQAITDKGVFQLDSIKRYQEREMMVVCVAPNKMEASVRFYPPSVQGFKLERDDIYADLRNAGVNYGIDEDAVNAFLEKRVYCTDMIIATGLPVRHGTDASIEYFFKTDLRARPTLNEDGSVDFFNLNTMNHVKKDDLLARLTREDPGDYGINVCGEQVKPRDVKRLNLKYGRNIYVNEDRTEAYCEVNGHVTLVDDKIFVSDVYTAENVDNATGDINYEGTVKISGNVCSNFTVRAKGNIEIMGVVEGATLEAGGDITIARGVNGMGKAVLKAGGNIISKYIENAHVTAKGFVETEVILHATVMAGTEVNVGGKKGLISGSTVCATNLISAKTLGSQMGADTVLELGVNPAIKVRYQELQEQIANNQKSVKQLQPVLIASNQKLASGVKMSKEQLKYIQDMAIAFKQLQQKLDSDMKEYDEIDDLLCHETAAKVVVKDTVFAGTKIAFNDLSTVVKQDYRYCKFMKSGGEVRMMAL